MSRRLALNSNLLALIATCWLAALTAVCGTEKTATADEPLHEVIDRELEAVWQRDKLTPAPATNDAEFLRRVSLDLVGCVPSHDETAAFLDSTSLTKRAEVIDRLLDDPRRAQHLADQWDLILFGRNPPGYDTDKRDGIQNWLREQFAKNAPYDELARSILRAEGNTVDQGAPMFYVQYRNQPEDATEAITQIFLGVQLQCARCHDHPFESWKQVDFYGVAAFLSRLEVVSVGKQDQLTKYAIGEKSTGDLLFTGPAKDQKPGKKGDPIRPKFLLGDELTEPALADGFQEVKFAANQSPKPPQFSRKDQLADWIASVENKLFARAIANRIWAQLMGRGIVHPIDNMSAANTPSHPELLDTLTRELVAHKFDLKWYQREIVSSKAYQLSSRGGNGEQFPQKFEAARSRPLSAEELVESWRIATGFDNAAKKSPGKPSRFRPLENGYMLRFFGSPNNGTGDFQGGLAEHLYLNNGPLSLLFVEGDGTLIGALSTSSTPQPERIERLYLSILSRRPTEAEQQKLSEYVQGDAKAAGDRWREAAWALMTSSEFRFNH